MKLKKEYISKSQNERLYQTPCPVIGLTGGIATGKSTVSDILKEKGLPIICADALVKDVYKTEKTITYLKKNHPEVLQDNGIDFPKLREIFFNIKNVKENIEQLIYSQMPQAFENALNKFTSPDVIIYDVPLLFEKGLDKLVDVKAVVYCCEKEQVKRLMKRDSIDETLANQIISNQMNIEDKKKLADIVIDNSSVTGPILDQLLNCFEQS